MTKKKSFSDKLKDHRTKKREDYAQVILNPPKRVSLMSAIPFPGVGMIMGDIRMGKSALAHEIAAQFREKRNLPAVLHVPKATEAQRKEIDRLTPKWMSVTTKRSQWKEGSVVIYDESAQTAHARRTQSGDALELEDLLSLAGQMGQLILFISHYSRKLDLNICTAVHRIIWKQPTFAHQLWEREEMGDFTGKALDFFNSIKGETARKRACLVLDMQHFKFLRTTNGLPKYWTDRLSRIFKEVQLQNNGIPDYK